MFPPAEHKIASALFAVEASCLLNLSGKNAYLAYECAAVRGVELLGARPDNADLTVDLALQRHQFLKQGPVIDITDNQEIDVALSVDATTRPRAEDRGTFNPRCFLKQLSEVSLDPKRDISVTARSRARSATV
jgi:hypothetical protein